MASLPLAANSLLSRLQNLKSQMNDECASSALLSARVLQLVTDDLLEAHFSCLNLPVMNGLVRDPWYSTLTLLKSPQLSLDGLPLSALWCLFACRGGDWRRIRSFTLPRRVTTHSTCSHTFAYYYDHTYLIRIESCKYAVIYAFSVGACGKLTKAFATCSNFNMSQLQAILPYHQITF